MSTTPQSIAGTRDALLRSQVYLVFDNNGLLFQWNEGTLALFPGAPLLGQHISFFLQEEADPRNGVKQTATSLAKQLEVLADASSLLGWGETVTLDIWLGALQSRRSLRCDCIVARFPSPLDGLPNEIDESTTTLPHSYAITLVRPTPTNPPNEHDPATRPYPRRHTLAEPPPPPSSSITSHSAPSSSNILKSSPRPQLFNRGESPSTSSLTLSSNSDERVIRVDPADLALMHKTLENITEPINQPKNASTPNEDGTTSVIAPPPGAHDLSLEALATVVDTVPHILFTATAHGQVNWLNAEWYKKTGLSHQESMAPTMWHQMFNEEDLTVVLPIWINAMTTGDDFRFEYRVKQLDGQYLWHVCAGRAKKDSTGAVLSWACSIVNIHELVSARAASLASQLHVRAVLSGADLLLVCVSKRGLLTFFEGSPETVQACGGKEGATIPILGAHLSEMLPHPELLEAMDVILSEEEPYVTNMIEHVLPDGSTGFARFRLVPLRGGPGVPEDEISGVIIVGSDLTDIIRTETALRIAHVERTELQASETAAKEANRLKTQFLTTVSHEIRTPIAGILGLCELLLDDKTIQGSARDLIEQALRSGETLLDLVGMVLDLRKIETGELVLEETPFTLSQILEDTRIFGVIAHKKGISLVETIGEHYQLVVIGDRLRLRQILANALSNAVKFTMNGGVTLRVKQEEETEEMVWLKFEIEDTGVGIAESVLPELFQPFKQADASTARRFGGSGLGLVITKQLVELMGGSVTLQSTLGKGTTMSLLVPLSKAPIGSPLGSPPLSPEAKAIVFERRRRPSDVRILLAEDNDLIRDIVVRTLGKMNFAVEAVTDGVQAVYAVHTAAEEGRPYDLILMDGQMPVLDGYAATTQIRASTLEAVRKVRIVALTASAIQGDRERCINAGMDSYLAKPVRAKELEAAIWEQLDDLSGMAF